MITYIKSTGLHAQAGRTVDTFPSGLVRVVQTYIGLTANASAHRAALAIGNDMPDGNSTPCIDGLKIFPEVPEKRREDGMTEYVVTAYGRCNTTGNKSFSKTLGELSVIYGVNESIPQLANGTTYSTHISVQNDQVIWSFVRPQGATPDVQISEDLHSYTLAGSTSVLLSDFFARTGYNTASPSIAPIDSTTIVADKKIALAQSTNFGAYDEWKVVWTANPTGSLNFGYYYRIHPPAQKTFEANIIVGDGQRHEYQAELLFFDGSAVSNNGNGFAVALSKIESLHITQPARTSIPVGIETATYRGGLVQWQANGSFRYAGPQATRPPGQPGSASATWTNSGFTWTARFVETITDSVGTYDIYTWQLADSYDVMECTLTNELGQESQFSIHIKLTDPQYPAP